MAIISTKVRMTMVAMSPLVALAAEGILPGHPSTWTDRIRFGDINDAVIDTAGLRRPPVISRGNRHARRAAAAQARRA